MRILQEAGMSARDVCRKHNVCEQSVYRWKAQDGGLGVRAVKRLRARARGAEKERRRAGIRHADAQGRECKKILRLPKRRRP